MSTKNQTAKNEFHAAKDRLHAAVVKVARHLQPADADAFYHDVTDLLDAITTRLGNLPTDDDQEQNP